MPQNFKKLVKTKTVSKAIGRPRLLGPLKTFWVNMPLDSIGKAEYDRIGAVGMSEMITETIKNKLTHAKD